MTTAVVREIIESMSPELKLPHILKKDVATSVVTAFGAGIVVIGARTLAEQMTKEQIKKQEELEEQKKTTDENNDNYLSGEASQMIQENVVYAH